MKVNISTQLFQPLLARLEGECQELLQETAGHAAYQPETLELRSFVNRKLRQLEMVRVSLNYMEREIEDPLHHQLDLRETLRQHKLELRFARRRWKRQQVSEARMRRTQEKSAHVPTFAA